MRFRSTEFDGAWLIEPEPIRDDRGFFMRTFCTREFGELNLEQAFVQHSVSYSSSRGTIRGMHYQVEPHGEVKVVGCRRGAIWDVIIDLGDTDSAGNENVRIGRRNGGSWNHALSVDAFDVGVVSGQIIWIGRGDNQGMSDEDHLAWSDQLWLSMDCVDR